MVDLEEVSIKVIRRATQVVETMTHYQNNARAIFPTEEHGVLFYWPNSENQLTIEVEPSGSVYIHTVDMKAGTFQDESLSADDNLIVHLAKWLEIA